MYVSNGANLFCQTHIFKPWRVSNREMFHRNVCVPKLSNLFFQHINFFNLDVSEIERCFVGMFPCKHNQFCVYQSWRCDGENDCGDLSDEFNCGKWNLSIPFSLYFLSSNIHIIYVRNYPAECFVRFSMWIIKPFFDGGVKGIRIPLSHSPPSIDFTRNKRETQCCV